MSTQTSTAAAAVKSSDSADAFWSALIWREHRGPWHGVDDTVEFDCSAHEPRVRVCTGQAMARMDHELGIIVRGRGVHATTESVGQNVDLAGRRVHREVVELVDLAATVAALHERAA